LRDEDDVTSSIFKVTCGVRQGGILSPIVFKLYVGNLIDMLQESDFGYHVG